MNKTRQAPSARRIIGMVGGVIIIALGIALFKQAHLGNDSISALNMRIAELLGISLGVENICINMIFFIAEIWFGRKYIGLGTFVNGLGIGFIITAFYDPIAAFFGPAEAAGLPVQLLWMAVAVPVTALGDREHAVITAGGVNVKEVDPKTMQSKLCPGLYFAGELIDCDAYTGGFNLQIAWATGRLAGQSAACARNNR